MRFLAAGNLTIDDVVTDDGAITVGQCGGNGLYAALGMWVWDADVTLLAGVGTDYPVEWLSAVASAGIDVSHLWNVGEPHALRSRVFYRADGSRTDRAADFDGAGAVEDDLDLSDDLAAFGSDFHRRIWPSYSPDASRLPAGGRWDAVHICPGPTASVTGVANALAARQTPVVTLDWPWWTEEGEVATALLAQLSAVVPGAEELLNFGGDDEEHTLRSMAESCAVVVEKCGSRGSMVISEGVRTRLGVFDTAVADPTGAGDAFCGGLAVGLARTGDPVLAAAYGAVSASYIVSTRGGIDALTSDLTDRAERLEAVISTAREGQRV